MIFNLIKAPLRFGAAGPIICFLLLSLSADANVCFIPGTTLQWATDECMLEADSHNAMDAAVLKCLAAKDLVRQSCELNEQSKRPYCAVHF